MSEREKNKKGSETKGIEPLKWWEYVLIPVDFILFHFSFFQILFWNFINENKGITFTLFSL